MKNNLRSKLTQFVAGVKNLMRGKPWLQPHNAPPAHDGHEGPIVPPREKESSGRGIVKIHNLVASARRRPEQTVRDSYGNLYFLGEGGALYRHQEKVRGKRARQRERGRRKEARKAAAAAAQAGNDRSTIVRVTNEQLAKSFAEDATRIASFVAENAA